MQLLLATNNPGKLQEFRALLAGLDLTLIQPAEISLELEVEETGETYRENALLKASAFADASGLWSLADDSGLEVDRLEGAPGLYSARYAPQANASDADRRAFLLENLQEHPRPWTARFRCTAALCSPNGTREVTEGICPGEIVPDERGTGGFGYDPIFLVKDQGKTMAELDPEVKNSLSHRGRALQLMIPFIQQITAAADPT